MRKHGPKGDTAAESLDWPYTKARWLQSVAGFGLSFGLHWLPSFHVELKPDLGDDYHTVLRQAKGYRSAESYRCVVSRRYAFESVTWDQVKKIFAASGITLIAESDIATAGNPEPGCKVIPE